MVSFIAVLDRQKIEAVVDLLNALLDISQLVKWHNFT